MKSMGAVTLWRINAILELDHLIMQLIFFRSEAVGEALQTASA